MIRRTALLLLPALVLPAGEVREEILVVVNNHIISKRAFTQAVEQETASLYRKFSGKELDEKLKETRDKTLQSLIDVYLMEDKASELTINITDEDMRSMVEDIKKQYQFATDADLEHALRSSMGIGVTDWVKRSKQSQIQRAVLGREVYSKIAIEDQELRAWYEDHRDEYRQPSRFRIRELVIAKGATPEERTAAKAKVAEIQAELKKGKSFEELVRASSVSPSKDTGGDLGWMNKGLLRPAVEAAALALKTDQVSAPIESDKDICLVQLISADIDAVKPFADVRNQILEKLQEPKAQNAIENYMSRLRTRANIRYLVPKEQILKG
jgi:peptidyl-prolyl cis-trans isomerase SurA